MHDARCVRNGKAIGNTDEQLDALPPRARLAQRPRLERAAVHKLRDQIRPAVDVPDVVDREQMRMIERGEQAAFALEAGQPIGVRDEQVVMNK